MQSKEHADIQADHDEEMHIGMHTTPKFTDFILDYSPQDRHPNAAVPHHRAAPHPFIRSDTSTPLLHENTDILQDAMLYESGPSPLCAADLAASVQNSMSTKMDILPTEKNSHETSVSKNYVADPEYRLVHINDLESNQSYSYCSNLVTTSRFTIFNFLPKLLFYEFTKLANAYFLVISVLQTIKIISNTGGFPASLPALSIIITIDMFFACWEDYKRHRADNIANELHCQLFDLKLEKFITSTWRQLQVGDIVKVNNREPIPSDLLILGVSEKDIDSPTGICYLETKSLDGETNLKLRQGVELTYTRIIRDQDLAKLKGHVICEKPNHVIHRFHGSIQLGQEQECISINSVALRGSTLRNTDYMYGLVLNTGADTKIMMASSDNPIKWSNMEKRLNQQILYICALMLLLCLTGAIASILWNKKFLSSGSGQLAWYLYDPGAIAVQSPAGHFFIMFLYYFLLLNSFIPVSLYVSMTSVKFLQAYWMNNDVEMYDEESDTPCQVQTMSLNEELGQIHYIFSDKTGTLTRNVMEFRKCSIFGVAYGKMQEDEEFTKMRRVQAPNVNYADDAIFEDAKKETQRAHICNFFEHLAVCHTVMPEKGSEGELKLSASSPDEQALVAAAACFGYRFVARAPGKAVVEQDNRPVEYEIAEVLEFNSTRKRMSVIVRRMDKSIRLYCKGADSIIYARLAATSDPQVLAMRNATLNHMEQFASDGLRTLVIASAEIDPTYFESWITAYRSAVNDMTQIELRRDGAPNEIDRLMNAIENNMEILGATAVEDRLQDQVPETIAKLREAHIKIWMLTGDKEETAINIGFACRLLTNDITRVVFSAETHANAAILVHELEKYVLPPEDKPISPLALVIDGEVLEVALQDCPDLLLQIAERCVSVIACRVSPAQKSQLVSLVRARNPKLRTLAIGDGANDVSMIQTAHVGIGISGQEGMQAANCSDYAIAQFRFLQRLLLVHGRWNYIRMAKLILYIFYKNIMMNLTQYWYMLVNTGFSGQKFFLEWGLQGYNLVFTALPIILVSTFEQDVPAHLALEFPGLYRIGQQNAHFNTKIVWAWLTSCAWESIVISFGTVYGMRNMGEDADTLNMWVYGCAAFTIVLLVVTLKLAIHQCMWWPLHIVIFTTCLGCWIALAALISSGETYWSGVFSHTFDDGVVWILLPLIIFTALGRDIFWKGYMRTFRPSYRHLAQRFHAYNQDNPSICSLHHENTSLSKEAITAASGIPCENANMAPLQMSRQMTNRGSAFSYDAESVMVESFMATDRCKLDKNNLLERNESLGSSHVKARKSISDLNDSFERSSSIGNVFRSVRHSFRSSRPLLPIGKVSRAKSVAGIMCPEPVQQRIRSESDD